MQSALAHRRTTGHNRHVEAEKVKASKNSCREAAWFNRLSDLLPLVPDLLAVLSTLEAGVVKEVAG